MVQRSFVSSQTNETVAELPRFTSIPALSVGAVPTGRSALRVIILSPILRVVLLIYVVVPETVRSPDTITLLALIVPETDVLPDT